MKALSVVLAAALLVGTIDLGATSASARHWRHRVCHTWRHHHHWVRHCRWVW